MTLRTRRIGNGILIYSCCQHEQEMRHQTILFSATRTTYCLTWWRDEDVSPFSCAFNRRMWREEKTCTRVHLPCRRNTLLDLTVELSPISTRRIRVGVSSWSDSAGIHTHVLLMRLLMSHSAERTASCQQEVIRTGCEVVIFVGRWTGAVTTARFIPREKGKKLMFYLYRRIFL